MLTVNLTWSGGNTDLQQLIHSSKKCSFYSKQKPGPVRLIPKHYEEAPLPGHTCLVIHYS